MSRQATCRPNVGASLRRFSGRLKSTITAGSTNRNSLLICPIGTTTRSMSCISMCSGTDGSWGRSLPRCTPWRPNRSEVRPCRLPDGSVAAGGRACLVALLEGIAHGKSAVVRDAIGTREQLQQRNAKHYHGAKDDHRLLDADVVGEDADGERDETEQRPAQHRDGLHPALVVGIGAGHGEGVVHALEAARQAADGHHCDEADPDVRSESEDDERTTEGDGKQRLKLPGAPAPGIGGDKKRRDHSADGAE